MMSASTTADECIAWAKDDIDSAIRRLSEVVIEKCWGHDEVIETYSETLQEVMFDLIRLRKRL